MKTKPKIEGGTDVSKIARQPLQDALIRVIDLLVESRIKLDALEQVLKETNPMVHELYLGAIENLRAHKGEQVNRVLTQTQIKG